MSMLKDIKNIIIFIMSLLIIILLSFGIWLYNKNENSEPVINECIVNEEIDDTSDLIYVDIKGAVKKPGVYQVKSNSIVNDQTTPNMIQRISGIFERNALISKEI